MDATALFSGDAIALCQSKMVLALAALVVIALSATGTAEAADWRALAEQARQQSDHFRSIDPRAVDNARDLVQSRLTSSLEYLQRLEPLEQESWRQKLQLDQLAWTLSQPEPTADQVRSLSVRFYQSDEGLEAAVWVGLREALDRYQRQLRVSRAPALVQAEYGQRLAAIAELLEQQTGHPDALAVGGHLAWLSAAGQAPAFVAAVQREFQHPNVLLQTSRSAIVSRLAGIGEDVDQTEFVSATIQGAFVSGEVRFQARVTPSIAAASSSAEIEILISGRISAPNNVAVRRPVVLYTSSTADVEARKRIYWEGLGFAAGATSVDAVTSSQIHDVRLLRQVQRRRRLPSPGGRLITRLARNRAQRQKASAEWEASRETEQRVAEQIDEFVQAKLDDWNGQVAESLVAPLTRLGVLPEIQARTDDDHLFLDITKTGAGGLAAPNPPSWGSPRGTLALHMHETALTNFLTPSAAGARWSDRRFADFQKQLLGENSYEFRIGLHPRWDVVLDSQRPLVVRIREQAVRFEINVRELTLAGQSYPYPFQVAARYRLEPTTTVLRLARQGEVESSWTGKNFREPAEEARLSEFITRTFSGFFLEEAYTDGLESPAGGDWSALSNLGVKQVDLQPGWLRMTFDRLDAATGGEGDSADE